MRPLRPAHVFVFCLAVLRCGPSLPEAYEQHWRQARQAYEAGDYAAAAEHWRRARDQAESKADRDEAVYRQAASLVRAGQEEQALPLLQQLAGAERGWRTARASFDLAFLAIGNGERERGHELLKNAILRFPNSGLARDAVARRRRYLVETRGAEHAVRDLATLARRVAGTELEATPLFERAKLLQTQGDSAAALQQYLEVARRFPYPKGAYWDDATLAAARIALELGSHSQAEGLLTAMLEHRESASLTGSYERSYDEAYWLLGEAHLEQGQWRRARQRWLALVDDFPTSRLRDDALWAAATVSFYNHEPGRGCELGKQLRQRLPASRFATCSHLLCDSNPRGRCADYIQRAFEAAAGGRESGVP